ncbi:MAG: hypothetical protein ACRDY3_12870, partial [Acidimicrobiales bacterium]
MDSEPSPQWPAAAYVALGLMFDAVQQVERAHEAGEADQLKGAVSFVGRLARFADMTARKDVVAHPALLAEWDGLLRLLEDLRRGDVAETWRQAADEIARLREAHSADVW